MELRGRRILHYLIDGRSVFSEWLDALSDHQGQAAIDGRLDRMAQGNFGDCRPVGGGVWELRVHSGPGYRIYYGEDGEVVVVLLCGGDKRSQRRDIIRARRYLADYRRRK